MADVLRVIGEPKVSFPIVQPVIVDMVNHETGGGFHYLPVHGNGTGLSFPFGIKISPGVKNAGIF